MIRSALFAPVDVFVVGAFAPSDPSASVSVYDVVDGDSVAASFNCVWLTCDRYSLIAVTSGLIVAGNVSPTACNCVAGAFDSRMVKRASEHCLRNLPSFLIYVASYR